MAVGSEPSAAGPAIGQFELKDLEAEPGEVEFQSQNAYSFGQPRRRSVAGDDPGEVIYDDNSVVRQRHALEMEFSLTHFFRMRVGLEFEKERLEEPDSAALADAFGDLKLDEVALEGVVVLLPVPRSGGIGLGIVGEFEAPVGGDDLNSFLIGPIIEARFGSWSAIGNFTFVKHFGNGSVEDGELERDDKVDFAYATQIKYTFSDTWALALEGYGTLDRLGNSGRPSEGARVFGDHDLHRAGPILYYARRIGGGGAAAMAALSPAGAGGAEGDEDDGDEGTLLTLGVGVLLGLNENTPDATLKWSLELEF